MDWWFFHQGPRLGQELKLEGDRLHFERTEGTGPQSGWVSTKLKDKAQGPGWARGAVDQGMIGRKTWGVCTPKKWRYRNGLTEQKMASNTLVDGWIGWIDMLAC